MKRSTGLWGLLFYGVGEKHKSKEKAKKVATATATRTPAPAAEPTLADVHQRAAEESGGGDDAASKISHVQAGSENGVHRRDFAE